MPFKYELTWVDHARRWRKRYRGRTHYLVTPCNGKRDRPGYLRALREWERLKAWLDGFGPCPYLSEGRSRVLIPEERMSEFCPVLSSARLTHSTATHGASVNGSTNAVTDPPWLESGDVLSFARPELVATDRQPESSERRVSVLIGRFIERQERRAKSGKLTLQSLSEDKRQLEIFRDWLQVNYTTEAVTVDRITAAMLNHYRDFQEQACKSETTWKKRLQTVRKWFFWLLDDSILERPPRDLTQFGRMGVSRVRPVFFTPEQVRAFYRESPPLLRACIALALNAGFTQQDCSSLLPEHIDFDSGLLVRERSKTGVDQRAKLWPVTVRLLREVQNPDPTGPLLVTPAGKPLVLIDWQNGKISKSDHVRRLSEGTLKAAGITDRSFKHLRKTSGNEVEKRNALLTTLFLAHGDRRTAVHYVARHFDELFAITDELEKLFALGTVE